MHFEPKLRIQDESLIRILICWLLDKLGAMSSDRLLEILTEDELVNYFDFMAAVPAMTEKKLIGAFHDKYELLENGKMMAEEFESMIPLTAREKTLATGERLHKNDELKRTLKYEVIQENQHWFFCVHLLGEKEGPNLLSLKVYAPSKESAELLQKRFLENPFELMDKTMGFFLK